MKCRYCGGEIRLEDMTCPYCGRPNEEAQRHAQDMRRYQNEFRRTKADVTEKAGRSSRRAVKIAAIAFLIAGIVFNIVLQANSYSFSYALEQRKAMKNAPVYIAGMNKYLEAEDYLGFVAYCENNHITMLNDVYDKYYRVLRIARNYKYTTQEMMKLVNHGRYTSVDFIIKYLEEYDQEFYESLNNDSYSYYEDYDKEDADRHIQNMKDSMKAMYIAYLDMTEEEADSMEGLTRGGRMLLIERGAEKYREAEDE